MAGKRSSQSSRARSCLTVRAFFLFEVIIYISCTILLATVLYPALGNLYGAGLRTLNQTDHVLNAAFGFDRLSYDIQCGAVRPDIKNKQEQVLYVLTPGHEKISWFLSGSKLMRLQEHNRRVLSTVFTNCALFEFTYYASSSCNIYGVGYCAKLVGLEKLTLTGFAAQRVGRVI